MTNIEDFNERFPENTPIISSIHYFVMKLYVYEHHMAPTPVMDQNEVTFIAIDVLKMDNIFLEKLVDERKIIKKIQRHPQKDLLYPIFFSKYYSIYNDEYNKFISNQIYPIYTNHPSIIHHT